MAEEYYDPADSSHDEPASEVGLVQWPLADNLGSVRDLAAYNASTDTTTITQHYTYDTFGNATSGDTTLTRYLYTSQEYDPATAFYYYDARWYDPATGTFASTDPSGLKPDSNPYRYVLNSPTNHTDPTGKEPKLTAYFVSLAGPLTTALSRYQQALQRFLDKSNELRAAVCNPRNSRAIEAARKEYENARSMLQHSADTVSRAQNLLAENLGSTTPAMQQRGAELSRNATSTIQQGQGLIRGRDQLLQIDPNKLNHIFGDPGHKLDGLVQRCGDMVNAYHKIRMYTGLLLDRNNLGPGLHTVTIRIGNLFVNVQITVIDQSGNFDIRTAYIP